MNWETELENLNEEIKKIKSMTDQEVLNLYDFNTKQELLTVIREEIEEAKFQLELQRERDIWENEMLETYDMICSTQSLPRYS